MKKIITTTFCILIISSLLLSIGTVMAAEPGYERTSYITQVIPTIDGKWTTDDEWTDGNATWIGTDVVFRSTWDEDGGEITERWIVEFLTDTTDDAGDFWRFCTDASQSGGSSPMVGQHRMFEITGHTDLAWYSGDGTGWTTGTILAPVEWADSLSTSSASSTPHWILEFQIKKTSGGLPIGEVWNFLLQAYDANNPGFNAWPPTDPDVPDLWGVENYSTEVIPEGLTFAVMALLTTVSMLVGYKYFIKRKETKTQ